MRAMWFVLAAPLPLIRRQVCLFSVEAAMADSPKPLSTSPGAPVAINPATGKPPRWKMALDVERCIGCHACSVACKVENNVPLGGFRTKVYYFDQGKFPKVTRSFL